MLTWCMLKHGGQASANLSLTNPHNQNVLVRRAQSRVRQTPFLLVAFSGLRKGRGRTPTLVLCSRNARPQKGLVRRPHLDQRGCLPIDGKRASLGESFGKMIVVRRAQMVTKPGHRVYYTKHGREVVVLLAGSDNCTMLPTSTCFKAAGNLRCQVKQRPSGTLRTAYRIARPDPASSVDHRFFLGCKAGHVAERDR